MPDEEVIGLPASCDSAEETIRKSLHEMIRLLAREVARQLSLRAESSGDSKQSAR
jgi:hypothetical protein